MKLDSLHILDGAITMTGNVVSGYAAGPVLTGGAHTTNCESILYNQTFSPSVRYRTELFYDRLLRQVHNLQAHHRARTPYRVTSRRAFWKKYSIHKASPFSEALVSVKKAVPLPSRVKKNRLQEISIEHSPNNVRHRTCSLLHLILRQAMCTGARHTKRGPLALCTALHRRYYIFRISLDC
jgi:hypothetical protein